MAKNDKFIRLTRRSDGQVYQFGSQFVEVEIEGIGRMEREVYSEPKGVGNGGYKTGARIPERVIRVMAVTPSSDDSGIARHEIDAFFIPDEVYRLDVTYKKQHRWIDGELQIYDMPLDIVTAPQVFEFELFCVDPEFNGADTFDKDIANVIPQHGYPMYLPYRTHDTSTGNPAWENGLFLAGGDVYGIHEFKNTVELENDGDFPAKPVITARAADDVVDFRITNNDTGEFVAIRSDVTIHNGQVLVMDFPNQLVTLDGENINRYITNDSYFFEIARGGQSISYSSTTGETALKVTVSILRKYKAGA